VKGKNHEKKFDIGKFNKKNEKSNSKTAPVSGAYTPTIYG
jgi:hypothetical protein